MIYRACIGDYSVLLDDELTDERPTPEVAADYLARCVDQVLKMYDAIPDVMTNDEP
jgi:hypothetical protein